MGSNLVNLNAQNILMLWARISLKGEAKNDQNGGNASTKV